MSLTVGLVADGQEAGDGTLGSLLFGADGGIGLPVLAGDRTCEVLRVDADIRTESVGRVTVAHGGGFAFARLRLVQDGVDLETRVHDGYAELLALIARVGCPHLLKIANYIPAITAIDGRAPRQRYHAFSLGRARALGAVDALTPPPAACALGLPGDGAITVACLAADRPGQAIENPRQVSAFRYPSQYGAQSPSFSRAMLTPPGADRMLLLSGTASIVGHETRHPGDVAAQTDEAVANVVALLEASGAAEPALSLRAYLRRPEDLGIVQARLRATLDPNGTALFLQADICRDDLLVEIEGAYTIP